MTDSSDRRNSERHRVYLAARIANDKGDSRSAITQDASSKGLLLLTTFNLELGQKVEVTVLLPGDTLERRTILGRVVRRELLDPEERSIWRDKVAVEMEEVDASLADVVRVLSAQQVEMLGE